MKRMKPASTYQEMLRDIVNNLEANDIENNIIGILVTRPDLQTGQAILNNLEYYHFRTGNSIYFYLPGYDTSWNDAYPDAKAVTEIDGVKWYFSNEKFVDFIENLESYSKWRYWGESELILVSYEKGQVSFEKAMMFHLDQMLRDKVIFSIQGFFEQLFRLCKDRETLNEISNSFGVDKAKQIVSTRILEMLPEGLGKVFTQEKYFCLRNLER